LPTSRHNARAARLEKPTIANHELAAIEQRVAALETHLEDAAKRAGEAEKLAAEAEVCPGGINIALADALDVTSGTLIV
jgi:hypothetical protein